MQNTVVEWAPFDLKDGVDEAGMLKASQAMQEEFLARQPGFIRRELLKGEGGKYVDILWWASLEEAKAAVTRAHESAACARYFDHMQPCQGEAGAGILHFQSVRSY